MERNYIEKVTNLERATVEYDIAEAYMRLREGIKALKDVMKDLIQICEEL